MAVPGSTNVVRLPEPVQRDRLEDTPCAACPVREFAVCSGLEDWELDRLNAIRMPSEVPQGSTLFDEGGDADYVYNLTSGSVKLYKLLPDGRRQITGFVFPGDFLGLAHDTEYVYTAEAVSDASLCKFKRKQLNGLFKEFPRLESRLLSMSRDELAEAHNQMLLLGRKTAKERIASFLMMLAQRAEELGFPNNPIEVPMSRNDIGDYLGLTTETVSRTLTRLKKADVIAIQSDRRITLANLDALQDMADGF